MNQLIENQSSGSPAEKCGYVALLGAPNAGKSTLLNAVLGQKLAIVTPKAQTTRTRMLGIAVQENAQMIFMDAAGVFEASRDFEKAMVQNAWQGLADADVILWMHDCVKRPTEETEALLKRLSTVQKPIALVLNKTDALEDKNQLLKLTEWFAERVKLATTFMISAKNGEGVSDIMAFVAEHLPVSPWLYPEDQMTDAPTRFVAAEITREQCFLALREELPYALHVETESFEHKDDGSVKINQVIIVENERQKKIVLGKNGAMLKSIGQKSRHEISQALDTKAHVFLFVKVKNNWKQDQQIRADLGFR